MKKLLLTLLAAGLLVSSTTLIAADGDHRSPKRCYDGAGGDKCASIDNVCAICMELLLVDRVALDCFHAFCKNCLQRWVAVKPSCPTCRAKITAEDRTRLGVTIPAPVATEQAVNDPQALAFFDSAVYNQTEIFNTLFALEDLRTMPIWLPHSVPEPAGVLALLFAAMNGHTEIFNRLFAVKAIRTTLITDGRYRRPVIYVLRHHLPPGHPIIAHMDAVLAAEAAAAGH